MNEKPSVKPRVVKLVMARERCWRGGEALGKLIKRVLDFPKEEAPFWSLSWKLREWLKHGIAAKGHAAHAGQNLRRSRLRRGKGRAYSSPPSPFRYFSVDARLAWFSSRETLQMSLSFPYSRIAK